MNTVCGGKVLCDDVGNVVVVVVVVVVVLLSGLCEPRDQH